MKHFYLWIKTSEIFYETFWFIESPSETVQSLAECKHIRGPKVESLNMNVLTLSKIIQH